MALWRDVGYGHFQNANDGTRLSEAPNRILPPGELLDLMVVAERLPFDRGTPFFECDEFQFLSVNERGMVIHMSGYRLCETLS